MRSWFGTHAADFDGDWFAALASGVAALEQQGQAQPAATLVHELQHSRIYAIHDVSALHELAGERRYYSPWRADPWRCKPRHRRPPRHPS